jgi:hypothetical protein
MSLERGKTWLSRLGDKFYSVLRQKLASSTAAPGGALHHSEPVFLVHVKQIIAQTFNDPITVDNTPHLTASIVRGIQAQVKRGEKPTCDLGCK